jgi:pimeloyl-ACP methyl ester carboxylesterase
MSRLEFDVLAPDGRRLFAEIAGPEDGSLVVAHSGTPGTRRVYERHLQEGAERGLRHLTYSRPGYEGSDRLPGRCFADCVADVVALVDELDVDTFHVLGCSGGGPHALACAALLPERVLSAASVSGFVPRDAEGLDWLAGMCPPNVEEFNAVEAGDAELQDSIEELARHMGGSDDSASVEAALGVCLPKADKECMADPSFEAISQDGYERSVSTGIWGWFDDDKAAYIDWGFALAEIAVPISIWHGTEDRLVPPAHGRWFAEQLPAASFHMLSGEGHISMYKRNYGAVLDELLALGA